MIYFIILPVWLLVFLFALVLLFFPKFRFLSLPIIFGSTLAVIMSAVALFTFLFGFAGIAKEVGSWSSWQRLGDVKNYMGAGIGILGLLASFGLGALLGGLVGLILGWWVDRKIGWTHRPLFSWISSRLDHASSNLAKRE